MLTVIIYKKSSQYFIDRYRSLMQPYLDAGNIAFCFWDENGDDISSSVLKLSETVRGITQWRAIIAMPLEEEMSPERIRQHSQKNPFEYGLNADIRDPKDYPKIRVEESPVPLIRLAQMLGGVPLPGSHYVGAHRETREGGQKLSIERVEQEEQMKRDQAMWEELDAKYSFDCDRPTYLYLFSARIRHEIEIPTDTDQEVLDRSETDSSMFWYRNRYPAKARFLTQDCSRPGHAHFREDQFAFWMTVLTLALNDIPSGMLDAYKVYQVKTKVNREQLHQVLSDYYNRLGNVQFQASRNIAELQKSSQYVREMDELPHYQVTVPVEFQVEEQPGMTIPDKGIGFAGDCPIREEPWWHSAVDGSVTLIRKLFRSLQIVLDRASVSCRYGAHVMDTEIHELDEYQMQDMQEELTELEQNILVFNTYTALPIKKYYRDLEAARKSAATSMRKRMSRRATVVAGIMVLLLYLAGFVPDLIDQVQKGSAFKDTAVILFLGCDILAIAMILCLFHFRSVIRMKIRDYNGIVRKILENVRHAGEVFSTYLSQCCSYMRGKGMLQALLDRSLVSSMSIKLLSLHKEKLEEQMQVIRGWLADLGLRPLPDKGEFSRVDFDFDIEPAQNREYLIHLDFFDLGRHMNDGSRCRAPYPFVEDLEIRRESLYEKVETDQWEEGKR